MNNYKIDTLRDLQISTSESREELIRSMRPMLSINEPTKKALIGILNTQHEQLRNVLRATQQANIQIIHSQTAGLKEAVDQLNSTIKDLGLGFHSAKNISALESYKELVNSSPKIFKKTLGEFYEERLNEGSFVSEEADVEIETPELIEETSSPTKEKQDQKTANISLFRLIEIAAILVSSNSMINVEYQHKEINYNIVNISNDETEQYLNQLNILIGDVKKESGQ